MQNKLIILLDKCTEDQKEISFHWSAINLLLTELGYYIYINILDIKDDRIVGCC